MAAADARRARDLLEELRRIHHQRRTGTLALTGSAADVTRLHCVRGEIYLERGALVGADGDPDPEALIEVLGRAVGWSFEPGVGGIPSDLAGPVSRAAVTMPWAVRGRSPFDLLKQLGGHEVLYRAAPDVDSESLPDLDPQEAFLLSRLAEVASVGEVAERSGLGEEAAVAMLCRLRAAGLIESAERRAQEGERVIASPELVQRFSERVADSLERDPLEVDAESHRHKLAELLGSFGELTHYELLGVDLASTQEAVHEAYLELARWVHPGHAEALGLVGREGGLKLLFERATEAYLVLSDSERSREYLQRIGSSGAVHAHTDGDPRRREEAKRTAEGLYKRAWVLARREEYHFAIELLHQALRTHPTAEAYALLGDCQAHNPRWLDKAAHSYRRAVELDPEDPNLRAALARVLERSGRLELAGRHYRGALDLDPAHAESLEAQVRLARRRQQASAGGLRRILIALRRLAGR